MYNTEILVAITVLAGTSLSQKSDSQFCSADAKSVLSLLGDAATTPPSLATYLNQYSETPTGTLITLPVAPPDFIGHAQFLSKLTAQIPCSLLPDFATYAHDLFSFGKAYSSVYEAYITNCVPEPEAASMNSYLNYIFNTVDISNAFAATGCQSTPTSTNSTYLTSHSPTVTNSYITHHNSTTLIATAAAARPTGALFGAAAMGGVLDSAAIL